MTDAIIKGRRPEAAALAATAVLGLHAARANGVDLSLSGLGRKLREAVAEDPMQAALTTVMSSAVLFYLAERGVNPKINSLWDSLVFCTTSLSVGYADSFARTDAG